MDESYVYLIGNAELDDSRYKIGRSKDPHRRLSDLMSGSPYRLVIVWYRSGGSKVEQYLHYMFQAYWIHGEWFKIDGDPIPVIEMVYASFDPACEFPLMERGTPSLSLKELKVRAVQRSTMPFFKLPTVPEPPKSTHASECVRAACDPR